MRAPCGKVKEWGLSQPISSILMILSTITHPVVGEPPFSGNPHLTIDIYQPRCEPWCWNICLHNWAILGVSMFQHHGSHVGRLGKWGVLNIFMPDLTTLGPGTRSRKKFWDLTLPVGKFIFEMHGDLVKAPKISEAQEMVKHTWSTGRCSFC